MFLLLLLQKSHLSKESMTTITEKLFCFRTGVVQAECATCKPKRPNPDKHLYTEKTIEMGLVTDSYLWENMKVIIYRLMLFYNTTGMPCGGVIQTGHFSQLRRFHGWCLLYNPHPSLLTYFSNNLGQDNLQSKILDEAFYFRNL
jgi:hypothetical protein